MVFFMPLSLFMLLVMLIDHVGKDSNSHSLMFCKIGVLKIFAIFTGKHMCWSLLLIKLQDWILEFSLRRDSNRGASYEYWEIFKSNILPKFDVLIDIRYFRAIFCYCKVRSHNRINFMIDLSKFLVKRSLFLN